MITQLPDTRTNNGVIDLQATLMRFDVQATSLLQFGTQPGSQLRGALFNALRRHACPLTPQEAVTPRHSNVCPVCALLAPRDRRAARGHSPPPPFALLTPPGDGRMYRSGDNLALGLTLFGQQRRLFPYVLHGLRAVGQEGVGRGRGTFSIRAITAFNPLSGEVEDLLDDDGTVRYPTINVTRPDVESVIPLLSSKRVTLKFQTPTRLKANGRIVRRPYFDVLIPRLLERLDLLLDQYAPRGGHTPFERLNELSEEVRLVEDRTRWINIRSGSRRHGHTTPIGGFVGYATYDGPLAEFLPWLLWGSVTQVGKSATKGNGRYAIVLPQAR